MKRWFWAVLMYPFIEAFAVHPCPAHFLLMVGGAVLAFFGIRKNCCKEKAHEHSHLSTH